jgi:hypothetical protein
MPFDGIAVRRHASALADAAADLGIRGISEAVLIRHKQAEAAKYRHGNFLYRHQAGMMVVLDTLAVGGLVGMMATVGILVMGVVFAPVAALFGVLFYVLPGAVASMIVAGVLMEVLHVRGPAEWVETDMMNTARVPMPRPIKDVVTRVKRTLLARGAWDGQYVITYGELVQDSHVLDPYVLVQNRRTGERLILGIWIDDTVLHIGQ